MECSFLLIPETLVSEGFGTIYMHLLGVVFLWKIDGHAAEAYEKVKSECAVCSSCALAEVTCKAPCRGEGQWCIEEKRILPSNKQ